MLELESPAVSSSVVVSRNATVSSTSTIDLALFVNGQDLARFSTSGSSDPSQWFSLLSTSVYAQGTLFALGSLPNSGGNNAASVSNAFGLGVALEALYPTPTSIPTLNINSRSQYSG